GGFIDRVIADGRHDLESGLVELPAKRLSFSLQAVVHVTEEESAAHARGDDLGTCSRSRADRDPGRRIFHAFQLRRYRIRELPNAVPIGFVGFIGLRPSEWPTRMVRPFGTTEWIAGQRMAVGLERGRPSLDVRIERFDDKNSVVAIGMIGKPLELVAAPRRVQVEGRHHPQEQCRLFYLRVESLAERNMSLYRGIHPDRNAALVVFCAQPRQADW